MPNTSRIICFPGRSGEATSAELNVMLGLREKAKLPAEGMLPQMIAGFQVYVRSLAGDSTGRRRRMSLRVRAICPYCDRDVAASRLRQHIITHPDELAAANPMTEEDVHA